MEFEDVFRVSVFQEIPQPLRSTGFQGDVGTTSDGGTLHLRALEHRMGHGLLVVNGRFGVQFLSLLDNVGVQILNDLVYMLELRF